MVLGSGIRDPEKTYSGSRIQGSKSTQSRIPDLGSRIRIRNTVFWCLKIWPVLGPNLAIWELIIPG
jgi:hypothetical protein